MTRDDPALTDPREQRLPVWAQGLIEELRRKAIYAQKLADEARLATDPAISLVQLVTDYDAVPIGLGSRPVTFRPSVDAAWYDALIVQPTRFHSRGLRVPPHRDGIEVRGVSSDALRISPSSSNVIHVWQGDR